MQGKRAMTLSSVALTAISWAIVLLVGRPVPQATWFFPSSSMCIYSWRFRLAVEWKYLLKCTVHKAGGCMAASVLRYSQSQPAVYHLVHHSTTRHSCWYRRLEQHRSCRLTSEKQLRVTQTAAVIHRSRMYTFLANKFVQSPDDQHPLQPAFADAVRVLTQNER